MQRLLEGFSLYLGALILSLTLAHFLVPYAGLMLQQNQMYIPGMESMKVGLVISDVIRIFLVGSFTLLIAIMFSSLGAMRLVPRAIFSNPD